MISKDLLSEELLSKVLGYKVDYIIGFETKYVIYHSEMGGESISYYEFSDKCKDWALDNGFEIYSKRTKNKGVAKIKKYIDGSKRKKLICCKIANTEIEAIFDICKWILNNK